MAHCHRYYNLNSLIYWFCGGCTDRGALIFICFQVLAQISRILDWFNYLRAWSLFCQIDTPLLCLDALEYCLFIQGPRHQGDTDFFLPSSSMWPCVAHHPSSQNTDVLNKLQFRCERYDRQERLLLPELNTVYKKQSDSGIWSSSSSLFVYSQA